MESELVNRRSGLWKPNRSLSAGQPRLCCCRLKPALPNSLLVLLFLLGLAMAGPAAAKGTLLLFPLKSHWLAQPLAEATTAALADRLTYEGYAVTQVSPKSSVVQLAASEEWIPANALQQDDLTALREPLGIAMRADGALFGELVERDTEAVLQLTLWGTISKQETILVVSVPREAELTATAGKLAGELVSALTAMTWGKVEADAMGKRKAAADRYAAGRAGMAAGMYQEAVLDFEAALLGEPTNPDYLVAAADARAALGDYSGAVVRMRSLATVAPSDAEISVQLGYAALRADRPAEAEAAFLQAAEHLGRDPRVVEGLAIACRAQGKRDRAQEYYEVLVSLLPALATSPPSLPSLLANSDVEVRLADIPEDEIGRELGRLYLAAGDRGRGVAWLLSYHQQGSVRPPYADNEYLDIATALDQESSDLAEATRSLLAARALGQSDYEQAATTMDALHDRSDALATVAERMQVSSLLDPAHRYRVLAYNLLNQSNFEALMYLQTQDTEREKRSDLLRDAFRKSQDEARSLAAGLLGSGHKT